MTQTGCIGAVSGSEFKKNCLQTPLAPPIFFFRAHHTTRFCPFINTEFMFYRCLRGLSAHKLADAKLGHVNFNPFIAECHKKSYSNLQSRSSGDHGVFFHILLISKLQKEESLNHGIPQKNLFFYIYIYILRRQISTLNEINERYRYQPPPNEGNKDSSFFSETG